MLVCCLDLEGVLIPEIWIALSQTTGIEELSLTTRDIPNYNLLMRGRLDILKKHGLGIQDIHRVVSTLSPLEGALEFLNTLREVSQVTIVSDTFEEFVPPLMKQLGFPFLLCNTLKISDEGHIFDYTMRQNQGKKRVIEAFKSLNLLVHATGDSYNDTEMLCVADRGILFRAPKSIQKAFPQLKSCHDYSELLSLLTETSI